MNAWLSCQPYADGVGPMFRHDTGMVLAEHLYSLATSLDKYPGKYPPEDTGSSGLAVAKAAVNAGYIKRYSWAFTLHGMLSALQLAPVIVGIPWYEGFDKPDSSGLVKELGPVRGGHEFLVRGYANGYFWADNSWGRSWGMMGSFRFSFDTWASLRKQGADVVCPHMP